MLHTVLIISEQIIVFQYGYYLKHLFYASWISINHKHGGHTYLKNVTCRVTGLTVYSTVVLAFYIMALVFLLKTIEIFIRFLSNILQ